VKNDRIACIVLTIVQLAAAIACMFVKRTQNAAAKADMLNLKLEKIADYNALDGRLTNLSDM
jgi:hypothetical protein